MAIFKKLSMSCIFGLGISYGTHLFSNHSSLGKQSDSNQFAPTTEFAPLPAYTVYVISIVSHLSRLGALTSWEALLGIITACLLMARPVASRCWKSLLNPGSRWILNMTSGMGPIVAWLSLLALKRGLRSLDYFSFEIEEYG